MKMGRDQQSVQREVLCLLQEGPPADRSRGARQLPVGLDHLCISILQLHTRTVNLESLPISVVMSAASLFAELFVV